LSKFNRNDEVLDDIISEQHDVNDVQNEYDETHPFEINDPFMAFDHIEYEENLSSEINDVFMAFDHMEPTINNNSTTHQQQNISNNQIAPPQPIRRVRDQSNRIQIRDQSTRIDNRIRIDDRDRTGRIRRTPFLIVDQTWNFDNPCQSCAKFI
jgi:hypothetical protein